jgi:cytochrome c oxidase subunit III
MSAIRHGAIDLGQLPESPPDHRATLWWGMAGLIVVETVVFATLVASYFYLKAFHLEWPPPGTKPPDLLLPVINVFVLALSSVTMHFADKGVKKDDQRALRFGLVASIVLAVAFLVIKVVEYSEVAYRWDTHAYASIVWTITGFHSAHVLALVLKTIVVATLAFRGRFHPDDRLPVTVNGLYWHFVVVIWIPLFFVLYITPRLG